MFKQIISLNANITRLLQAPQLRCQTQKFSPIAQVQKFCTANDENPVVNKTKNPFAAEPSATQKEAINPVNEDDREKKLKILKLEADIANQEGRRVPQLSFMQDHHWDHVLNLDSKSARMKYYSFLWQIEKKKEAKQLRKQERAEKGVIRKEEIRQENEANNHIIYGLSHTSLFLRIYDSTINHWQNNRLTRAMQFAPKLVLDCSYDEYMTKREAINAAKQLMLSFADNRAHDEPFDLHYCNVNMNTDCIQALKRHIPTMLNPEFPMNVHQECFTKIFPKENLVYLTPHCRQELHTYNPDDIYIIGAMVDKANNEPLSLAKAKRLGLRMARLPLDRHLQWSSGSGKSLTLNQMISIMLDLKKTGDWTKALTHVPKRKVIDEKAEIERQRNSIYKRAVHMSQGLDGRTIQHRTPQQPRLNQDSTIYQRRENQKFNIDTWASSKKSRIKQNSS